MQLFKPEEVVADVFAGVGPFAVPAAKKGCAVFANDLNPNSKKYLTKNVVDNRVSRHSSCVDCREIRFCVLIGHRSCPSYLSRWQRLYPICHS